MFRRGQGRISRSHKIIAVLLFCLALMYFPVFGSHWTDSGMCADDKERIYDHFDGSLFINPVVNASPSVPMGEEPKRGISWWILRWIVGNDWQKWPETADGTQVANAVANVTKGSILVTPVGHATFLIQLDGLNILTDPIWSERCSPVSWVGPKRHQAPGIRLEDLPPIDAVLVSHNHYDHLDLPTLKLLAAKGVQRSITTLGNGDLIYGTGIPIVDELDWWQALRISKNVTVTVVPAQHFSSWTLWDRNKTLWGGFIISGPSGNIFYSGDTGYGSHFRDIARRFSPIRVAILPIAPYRPSNASETPQRHYPEIHMGPAEAVQAHLDLRARLSIAAHFQVFQLGVEGFDDARNELKSALARRYLKPDVFITPPPGQSVELRSRFVDMKYLRKAGANR